MKKLLIAATVVGAAAAGVLLYMQNRDKADELLDRARRAARKTSRKLNKSMHHVNGKASKLWSKSMG
jgi:hypothetical protein